MTVVVVIFLPLVLAYQDLDVDDYVFRRRVSREQFMQGDPARRAARARARAPAQQGQCPVPHPAPRRLGSACKRGARHYGRRL